MGSEKTPASSAKPPVLRAKELVGPEPFAVVLSDDVIDAEIPCMRQLLDVYEFFGASVVALMEVPLMNEALLAGAMRAVGELLQTPPVTTVSDERPEYVDGQF